jgi:hypothetical protein
MKIIALPSVDSVSSRCERCGNRMRLVGIEPHWTLENIDLRTFECLHCAGVRTISVPVGEAESPSASDVRQRRSQ